MSQPTLVLMKNGEQIRSVSLEGEMILGRGAESSIRVPDRAISRQHALFKVVGDQVQVEKKSEFAPLSVNGAECTSAMLKAGDIVSAGPYLIRLDIPVEQSEAKSVLSESEHASSEISEGQAGLSGEEAIEDPLAGIQGEEAEAGEQLGEAGDLIQGDDALGGIAGLEGGEDPLAVSDDMDAPGIDSEGEAEFGGEDFDPPDTGAPAENDSVEEDTGPVDEDAKTKFTSIGNVSVKLVIPAGKANITELELNKDVVYLGRGKDCDVVLNDKKASRKNSMIRKSGLNFILKDLESANGTYLNGVRIQEQELSGDDVIRIGNVEIEFKALSEDYLAQESRLQSLPEEEIAIAEDPMMVPQVGQAEVPADPNGPGMNQGFDPNADPNSGIAGISPSKGGGKKTLLDRFKSLPKRQQILIGVGGAVFLWWLMEDNAPPPSPKKKVEVKKEEKKKVEGPQEFEALSPEQQQFVEAQHSLAFDYYKNKEYDKAIFEIQKIFSLVTDYKDSKEILRYAKEGKRKMEAIEEERARKEEEKKLAAKIAKLLEEARQRMLKQDYDQAQELFIEILSIEPDNKQVEDWKREIDQYYADKKLAQQQKEVEENINEHGWSLMKDADKLRKQGKYFTAIDVYQKAVDIGVSDKSLEPLAKKRIRLCYRLIAKRRDPILVDAKEKEEAGEYSEAYKLFKNATKADPTHPEGYRGMKRIRGVLHDRAKLAYTEAILAESFSDFENAKKLFKEALGVAPPGDIYQGRARRKLERYFERKEE